MRRRLRARVSVGPVRADVGDVPFAYLTVSVPFIPAAKCPGKLQR